MKSAELNTRTEKWTLTDCFPWVELHVNYEKSNGVHKVELYGFDGNSIEISGESIKDGSYKNIYPLEEEILNVVLLLKYSDLTFF